MNGIVIDINPVIFEAGGFALRWYTVAVILALATAVVIAARQARKSGINPGEIYSMLPWVMIAGIGGARLFHIIDRWDYYVTNPQQIIQLQHGGLAVWGALAGGIVAALIYAKLKHINIGRLLDLLVPAFFTAQIIGRVGCIINGDAYGAATTLPWGFIYTHPEALLPRQLLGVATHPYPVYEMIWNAAALLLVLKFKGIFKHEGTLFLAYLAHYSLVRFALTFVRQENITFGGLQQAQVLAIFGLSASLALFIYLVFKARHNRSDRRVLEARG